MAAVVVPTPLRNYILNNGETGNEFQAISEAIAQMENAKIQIEYNIETLKLRLELAEGRPK